MLGDAREHFYSIFGSENIFTKKKDLFQYVIENINVSVFELCIKFPKYKKYIEAASESGGIPYGLRIENVVYNLMISYFTQRITDLQSKLSTASGDDIQNVYNEWEKDRTELLILSRMRIITGGVTNIIDEDMQ